MMYFTGGGRGGGDLCDVFYLWRRRWWFVMHFICGGGRGGDLCGVLYLWWGRRW